MWQIGIVDGIGPERLGWLLLLLSIALVGALAALWLMGRAFRRIQRSLMTSEARALAVADNVPVLISYLDKHHVVRFLNKTYERWFGPVSRPLHNIHLKELWGDALYAERLHIIQRALSGETIEYVVERDTPTGQRVYQNTYVPDVSRQGEVRGFFMVGLDVTNQKRAEAELQSLLRTDSLTGLANRRDFNDRLAQAVERTRRTGNGIAVIYLDVDKFKTINDTHGHGVGDQVLIEVGHRLRRSVRVNDVAARLSGDEFVLILENVASATEAQAAARKLLEQFVFPVATGSGYILASVSMGVTFHSSGSTTPDELLAQADRALYASKGRGRGTYTLI